MTSYRIVDIFSDIKSHRFFLILYFLVFFLLSIALPSFLKPIYKSNGTVIVNDCRAPDPFKITNLSICPEIFIISEILKSETHLRKFSKILQEEKFINFSTLTTLRNSKNEQIKTNLIRDKHLRVSELTSRGLINISFLADSPQESADITNQFIKFSLGEVNRRQALFLNDATNRLKENPLNLKSGLRESISREIYKNYSQASIKTSTEPKLEVLDYAYPPDFRFAPSFRLIFVQINLVGVSLILIFYFLSKYIAFIRDTK